MSAHVMLGTCVTCGVGDCPWPEIVCLVRDRAWSSIVTFRLQGPLQLMEFRDQSARLLQVFELPLPAAGRHTSKELVRSVQVHWPAVLAALRADMLSS